VPIAPGCDECGDQHDEERGEGDASPEATMGSKVTLLHALRLVVQLTWCA
jgi:hypothetical protein